MSSREVVGIVALRPHQRVLEVGFGPGVVLRLLARHPQRPRLVGVEPSSIMLDRARRLPADVLAGLELRRGTAAATGLGDATVDHVVSVNTVAIWPDLDAGLDELRRVLRPGGTVTLAWHSAAGRSSASRRMALSPAAMAQLVDGLQRRFGSVTRTELTHVVVLVAVRTE